MLSVNLSLFVTLFLLTIRECKGEDKVIQPPGDVIAAEGDTVTLDCTFETSNPSPTLFWYKQEVNGSPQYMMKSFSKSVDKAPEFQEDRFHTGIQDKSVPLKIQKLQLSDSAVYYCALRTTGGLNKMIFGSGTRLTVEPRAEYKPSYFKLQHDGTTACLATGFSRHNAALGHRNYSNLFNDSEAVRISPDLALYNQVIFLDDSEDACEESSGEDVPCVDTMSPDKTVSMASVAVLGLRVILFKTIVFNVLLTMRLWISQ
nr:T cell receptor alpha chain [Stegastes partitus]AAO89006.1 T cell receptor alpha chain [Stegastes partitus]